ncbi:hypothetical protein ADLECEL_21190 [Adlercreutzia equolifaciens subsp. celatus]|uniref:LPXTG cell wall anchor domain-containing protein n=1 Tax=Adlercreutzia equolifaciens subsp. celatus DSM 18785 TaxID=1121021 RepID=A0A3N0AYU2_9ACTN|nr:hypothetical protein [Adlercreutzia equolifaciens]MCP2076582.1 hypothetical protein [Adlercreutzia equolifaciens subsp. celatus DSM 18785]RFT92058.1 hypothetical protein DX904_07515 [Adlercreutzia equolifaciens subsp. celatus]RNL40051.1 hypothetical protein DMP10_00365 [Adlercreutzia equolifaciens subsp. celatus DSM 18785]BCS58234.1 hypothetical protein ADLECEL_21190 [Adlercreutzia equolifaciens subsp. celatus]
MRRYLPRTLAATCSAVALTALLAGAPAVAFADTEADALAELQAAVELEQSGAADLQEAVDAAEENPATETVEAAVSTGQAHGANLDALPSGTSVQYQFAKLQLELSQQCKDTALDKMTQIRDQQAQQLKLAELINELLPLASTARKTGEAQPVSDDLLRRLDELDIEYDDSIAQTKKASATELNVIISNVQNRQETLGDDIQQEMAYVQDFMGQYNSYLKNASSATANAQNTLAALARGTVDPSEDSLLMQSYRALVTEQAEQAEQARKALEEQLSAFLADPSPEAKQRLENEISRYHATLDAISSVAQSMANAERSLTTQRGTVATDSTGNLAPLALGGLGGVVIGAVGAYALIRRRGQTTAGAVTAATASNAEGE